MPAGWWLMLRICHRAPGAPNSGFARVCADWCRQRVPEDASYILSSMYRCAGSGDNEGGAAQRLRSLERQPNIPSQFRCTIFAPTVLRTNETRQPIWRIDVLLRSRLWCTSTRDRPPRESIQDALPHPLKVLCERAPHVHYHSTRTSSDAISRDMTESDHWRMQLNNYLQGAGSAHLLSWDVRMSGPHHRPTWHATVYFRGIQYGSCSGPNQGAVREEAARQALTALWAQRGY